MADINQIHIFLDLDGVMADFDRHAKEQDKQGSDGKLIYDALDYQWWVSMPPCDGAKDFYDSVRNMGITKFLTAPVLSEDCFSGKAKWVENFTGRGKFALMDLIICPSTDKQFLARANHILIDDRIKNVQEWEAAGGIGIHHTGDFAATMDKLKSELAARPHLTHTPPVRKSFGSGNAPKV